MYLNCNLKVKVHQRERKRGTVREKKQIEGKTPKFKTKRLELLLPPPKYSFNTQQKK